MNASSARAYTTHLYGMTAASPLRTVCSFLVVRLDELREGVGRCEPGGPGQSQRRSYRNWPQILRGWEAAIGAILPRRPDVRAVPGEYRPVNGGSINFTVGGESQPLFAERPAIIAQNRSAQDRQLSMDRRLTSIDHPSSRPCVAAAAVAAGSALRRRYCHSCRGRAVCPRLTYGPRGSAADGGNYLFSSAHGRNATARKSFFLLNRRLTAQEALALMVSRLALLSSETVDTEAPRLAANARGKALPAPTAPYAVCYVKSSRPGFPIKLEAEKESIVASAVPHDAHEGIALLPSLPSGIPQFRSWACKCQDPMWRTYVMEYRCSLCVL